MHKNKLRKRKGGLRGNNGHRDEDMTYQLEDVSTDEEEDPNCTDPGKKASKRDKKMKRYKSTFERLTKLTFLVSSIILVAVAALRFTVIEMQSMHEAILNFYFLFFGVIITLQQLGLKSVKRNFRFLNYYWGKCLFCMFIGFTSLSNT